MQDTTINSTNMSISGNFPPAFPSNSKTGGIDSNPFTKFSPRNTDSTEQSNNLGELPSDLFSQSGIEDDTGELFTNSDQELISSLKKQFPDLTDSEIQELASVYKDLPLESQNKIKDALEEIDKASGADQWSALQNLDQLFKELIPSKLYNKMYPDESTKDIETQSTIEAPDKDNVPEFDINAAAAKIQSGDMNNALNLPADFQIGMIDTTTLVPSLGDQTGLTAQLINLARSKLYQQFQQITSAKTFLDSAPKGTKPNPNFSYIEGQPPYGELKDGDPRKKQQEKVFAKVKTNIISLLTRLANQLELAGKGLDIQSKAATSHESYQQKLVTDSIQRSRSGGGGGG